MRKPHYVEKDLIELALKEDVGRGDITTNMTIPPRKKASAVITAKSSMTVCGIDLAQYIYYLIDPEISVDFRRNDGETVIDGDILMVLKGNARALLTGERLVLNFMQRLSEKLHRSESSIWKRVVRDVVFARCVFSSHSAAFGIGKLFSLIPSKSSRVLPTPPTLPLRPLGTQLMA